MPFHDDVTHLQEVALLAGQPGIAHEALDALERVHHLHGVDGHSIGLKGRVMSNWRVSIASSRARMHLGQVVLGDATTHCNAAVRAK